MPASSPNIGSSAGRGFRSMSISPRSSAIARAALDPGGARPVRLPVGRDRRYARHAPLLPRARPAHPVDRQCARILDRARIRRRAADAGRARDRRRLDQGLHLPARPCSPASPSPPARRAGVIGPELEAELVQALAEVPRHMATVLRDERPYETLAHSLSKARDVLYLGRGLELSDRARGRAEAEGDLLHPRRGLCRRRAEAWPDRADRREHAGHRHRAARRSLRQDRVEHAGGGGARRARSCWSSDADAASTGCAIATHLAGAASASLRDAARLCACRCS